MISTLTIILISLLLIVGGFRGFKAYICFLLSYILIILYIIFMGFGFNAIILAFIECILATIIVLFILNGINKKTISSFISVIIVLIVSFFIVLFIGKNANLQGFTFESLESIGAYSFDINYNMTDVLIGMYLICTIGTIIDTSISISSALNEIKENNQNIIEEELFKSGMNVGKDILSTTINTLYFAFLGGFIGFLFLYEGISLSYIINYKAFAVEVTQLLLCFISSIMIIPITSFITSKFLNKDINLCYNLNERTSNGKS